MSDYMTDGKMVADVLRKTGISTAPASSAGHPELDKILDILSKVEKITNGPLANQIMKSARRKAGIEDPAPAQESPRNISPPAQQAPPPALNIDKIYRGLLSKINMMIDAGYDISLSELRDQMNKDPDKAKGIIKQFLG